MYPTWPLLVKCTFAKTTILTKNALFALLVFLHFLRKTVFLNTEIRYLKMHFCENDDFDEKRTFCDFWRKRLFCTFCWKTATNGIFPVLALFVEFQKMNVVISKSDPKFLGGITFFWGDLNGLFSVWGFAKRQKWQKCTFCRKRLFWHFCEKPCF